MVWKIIDTIFEEIIYWEIVGNIAAFGVWQVGYTIYDQKELFEELVMIRICKKAELNITTYTDADQQEETD